MQLRHKDKIRRAKETFIHEVKQRDSRIKQLENELSESKLQVEKVRDHIEGFSHEGRQGSRLQRVCRSIPSAKKKCSLGKKGMRFSNSWCEGTRIALLNNQTVGAWGALPGVLLPLGAQD